MADNLVFPIGFDLDEAVKRAGQEWSNTYADKLEKLLAKRTIKVKLGFDTKNFDTLDDVKRRLAELKIEPLTPENKAAIKELTRELNALAKIMAKLQHLKGIELPELQRAKAAKINNEIAQSAEKMRLAQERVRQSNERLILSQKRAEQQALKTRDAYNSQSSYLSNLIKKMAVYASFSYVGNFLRNIREVTAEFELQQVSLGAIIQDQAKANEIFNEIKSFALSSPLKILDLTKYTKQVAAYGFEAKKLFATTKMLADISVGLGTDMSRATLFLGQVFATGYLRASELRQATEMGIPLVAKLADKLEELNGRAYSAADVMDLISKRAIGYELVEQIFNDMTSAGGEFYNMQIKQSQTLFGMWSKLGDAAAIMYSEIGNTEGINLGMKTLIGLIESMMRNWKTTARVLDTMVIALGVYVYGIKNAAVATHALSGATALLNLAHKQQIIQTPKIVAAIIGQNKATQLSTILTRAHTHAVLKHAAATNILSKGFWKLTAAMLANPWVAAATAIAATATALFHFIGNTDTAAERAEKLNNSVASLRNLNEATTPLIDTYNELIKKTERTAEEQKKLNEVTHELAKQYPGAVKAVNDYGESIDLLSDKLNELHQAEKKAREQNVRNELAKNQRKANEIEADIEYNQLMLSSGDGRLSAEGIKMYLNRIDKLRAELKPLKDAIHAARVELGEIKPETEQVIDKFGAWKKTLTTFRKEVGGVRVSLFDDSTIAQFGSLEEALKKAAEEYKKNIALVKTYDDILKSTSLTADERAKIESERAEADTMATLAKNALDYYNTLASAFDKNNGGKSDSRLQTLQEMVSTLKQINKEYEDLAKKEGKTKALADVQRIYEDTFANMQQLATKYKFDMPSFGIPTDAASLTKYLNSIREAMKKLPKSDKAVLALQVDIDKLESDDTQKNIEQRLKNLADRISRTKTAKDFYEKILSTTGNIELAANLSLSIYGENGEDLNKTIRENIQETLGKGSNGINLDISAAVRADGSINYNDLARIAKGYLDMGEISTDTYNKILKMRDEDRKDLANTVNGWLKATEKAKAYGDKLADVYRTTNANIKKVQDEMARGNIDAAFGNAQIDNFRRKEAEEIATLQYEAFKDSPMYIQMFEDLDNVSSSMLRNMKARIEEMKASWNSLSPTQLKELQSRLNEIDAQLARRNPFKALADGMKEYFSLRTKGDSRGNKSRASADKDALNWTEKYLKAQEDLAKIKDDSSATDAQIEGAAQMVTLTKKQKEEAERVAANWKKVEDAIGLSVGELTQVMNWGRDLAKGIADVSEAFGADENDVQYWNDISDSLGQITSGVGDIVQSAMSGNIAGMVSASLTAIPKMIAGFSGLFSAGKVRKANKEIAKQQKLLERLEYSYERLNSASDKLFGKDYIRNYNSQIKNLQAQQTAYLKQAEAERSKGKKKDKDKIKEFEEAARDVADEIKELQDELTAKFLGSGRTDLAREFAESWLEAKATFANTADAIASKYKDMIRNMIVEGAAAKIIDNILAPMWKKMDSLLASGNTGDAIDYLVSGMDSFIKQADDGMNVLWESLKAKGFDMKNLLSDDSSSSSGIAKNISNASSEEINALAAGINTQNYYMSTINGNVTAIRQMLGGGEAVATQTSAGWTDWQQQAMDNYNAIARNTADTVVECRRAAEACEKITRAVKIQGSKVGLNVFLNN